MLSKLYDDQGSGFILRAVIRCDSTDPNPEQAFANSRLAIAKKRGRQA
jgi:hypothetical protein